MTALPIVAYPPSMIVSLNGRPAKAHEVHIRMLPRDTDGFAVRPHCTLTRASCLAAGRYRLVVRNARQADDVPRFAGSAEVVVPGPPVVVECQAVE